MNTETSSFTLGILDGGGTPPVLTSVHARGRLDGLLFEMTLRQVYRNTGKRVLEVVYTFPLPGEAMLAGFAAELNGSRREGVIVGKPDAERSYEEALTEGDAPVLLESLDNGIYTANIGNLKPDDEIVLEVRFAQLLTFEQGRLRLAIPTTIAPRFGDAVQSGLQPQQAPEADILVEYPLTLAITIGASFRGARVECPTHPVTVSTGADGSLQLELSPGARLDRDVVIILTPEATQRSSVIETVDTADDVTPIVRMAALQVDEATPRDDIDLRILVDCSGSMAGDSINSARTALRELLSALTPRDRLSFSRFGSEVVHDLAPAPATAKTLRHQQSRIDHMQADLGGTKMESALAAVFGLSGPARSGGSDVLLLTDGEIWNAAPMIDAARKSAHRIFAIGVGASPAESVLRNLAEASGGACEFATPGEALEAAARRMLHRLRQPVWRNARIEWGGRPIWETAPNSALFSGDTVMAFAGFADRSAGSGIRLLADDADGNTRELACCHATTPVQSEVLPRAAAVRRIRQAERLGDREGVVSLAVRYQILCPATACVLVHRRADDDKATSESELHKVSSMLAAGWGGTARVPHFSSPSAAVADSLRPAFSRNERQSSTTGRPSADISFYRVSEEVPSDLVDRLRTLEQIAHDVVDYINRGKAMQNLDRSMRQERLHPALQTSLTQTLQERITPQEAWVILAWWINSRPGGLQDASVERLLEPLVNTFDKDVLERCMQVFEKGLESFPVDGWTPLRWYQRV